VDESRWYSDPALGTFGNCSAQDRTVGLVIRITDIGLSKDFHLTEQKLLPVPGRFPERVQQRPAGASQYELPNPTTFGLINTSQPARNISSRLSSTIKRLC